MGSLVRACVTVLVTYNGTETETDTMDVTERTRTSREPDAVMRLCEPSKKIHLSDLDILGNGGASPLYRKEKTSLVSMSWYRDRERDRRHSVIDRDISASDSVKRLCDTSKKSHLVIRIYWEIWV